MSTIVHEVDYISSNLVMIQPTNHITKKGEWDLFDIHEPSKRFTVRATVLKVPNKLFHAKKSLDKFKGLEKCAAVSKVRQFLNNRSLEYDTQMELMEGDEVVFNYITHSSCLQDGLYWNLGEKNPALFINYDAIYMVIRGGEHIMVNGWVWVEPILWSLDDAIKENGMVVADVGQKAVGVGIVRNLGTPNKAYLYEDWVDEDDIKEGDEIMFKKTSGVSAEWFCHKTLNEGKFPYYIMQRHDIYTVKH